MQSPMRGSNSQNHKIMTWAETLNWLSHPAPPILRVFAAYVLKRHAGLHLGLRVVKCCARALAKIASQSCKVLRNEGWRQRGLEHNGRREEPTLLHCWWQSIWGQPPVGPFSQWGGGGHCIKRTDSKLGLRIWSGRAHVLTPPQVTSGRALGFLDPHFLLNTHKLNASTGCWENQMR